jgi:hypothetical protein
VKAIYTDLFIFRISDCIRDEVFNDGDNHLLDLANQIVHPDFEDFFSTTLDHFAFFEAREVFFFVETINV